MSLALPTDIEGFMGSGRDRRRDEMLPIFSRTTRKRDGAACIETVSAAERRARIKRYRRDVAADRPIRFIDASKPLSLIGYEAIHGPTAQQDAV